MTIERRYVLEPHDITVELLAALSTLTENERAAWIDAYVVGRAQRNRTMVGNANRRLRAYFESPDKLREEAA